MIMYNLEENPDPISQETTGLWRGRKVILVSDYNTSYIAGIAAQAGLDDCIVVSKEENCVGVGPKQLPREHKYFRNFVEAIEYVKDI